jgi:hypothetical protein
MGWARASSKASKPWGPCGAAAMEQHASIVMTELSLQSKRAQAVRSLPSSNGGVWSAWPGHSSFSEQKPPGCAGLAAIHGACPPSPPCWLRSHPWLATAVPRNAPKEKEGTRRKWHAHLLRLGGFDLVLGWERRLKKRRAVGHPPPHRQIHTQAPRQAAARGTGSQQGRLQAVPCSSVGGPAGRGRGGQSSNSVVPHPNARLSVCTSYRAASPMLQRSKEHLQARMPLLHSPPGYLDAWLSACTAASIMSQHSVSGRGLQAQHTQRMACRQSQPAMEVTREKAILRQERSSSNSGRGGEIGMQGLLGEGRFHGFQHRWCPAQHPGRLRRRHERKRGRTMIYR